MNFDSFLPFILIVAPFAIAFFMEALVIYFFKLKKFWPAIGIAFFINLVSLAVLYAGSMLMTKLGYEFNGLRLPLQVVLALWWLSVISDAVLLQFISRTEKAAVYRSSIVMNLISYFFLYFFIIGSH
jgi:hypothetical protein